MTMNSFFLVVPLLTVLLAQLSAAAVAVPDPCIHFRTYEACAAQDSCEWCGNKSFTFPTSLCHKKGTSPGVTCCAETTVPPNFFCTPIARLCNSSSKCSVTVHETSYGPCPSTACCPDSAPVACDGECLPTGSVCCGGGMSCKSTEYCCGGAYVGLACCRTGEDQCCSSPDGYSHWCCPSSQSCNINGGCDPSLT